MVGGCSGMLTAHAKHGRRSVRWDAAAGGIRAGRPRAAPEPQILTCSAVLTTPALLPAFLPAFPTAAHLRCRYAYPITCTGFTTDPATGRVTEVQVCTAAVLPHCCTA